MTEGERERETEGERERDREIERRLRGVVRSFYFQIVLLFLHLHHHQSLWNQTPVDSAM